MTGNELLKRSTRLHYNTDVILVYAKFTIVTPSKKEQTWQKRMAELIMKYEVGIGSVESDNEKKRMRAERLFSEWVHELWEESRKESQV